MPRGTTVKAVGSTTPEMEEGNYKGHMDVKHTLPDERTV